VKIRPKLVLSFSAIFVFAFISSSYIAHITIQSSLGGLGLSDEQVLSVLENIGMSIGVVSAIIGTAAILLVYWVSSRISMPMRQLDSQLKFQKVGHHLENIKIERSSIDKNDEINQVVGKKRRDTCNRYPRIKDPTFSYGRICSGSSKT